MASEQKFSVGQRVWMRVWADGEPEGMATYKDGMVTAVSKTGAKVWVTYSDGDVVSYAKTMQQGILLTEDKMALRRVLDREMMAKRQLREDINHARDRYDNHILRLWQSIRGDGQMDAAYLERLGEAIRQLGSIISSLATPVATEQQEPVK